MPGIEATRFSIVNTKKRGQALHVARYRSQQNIFGTDLVNNNAITIRLRNTSPLRKRDSKEEVGTWWCHMRLVICHT